MECPAGQGRDRQIPPCDDQRREPSFAPLAERIATFDQDGALWIEHPVYTRFVCCFDRVPALVKAKPELARVEPLRTVLMGNREAIARLGVEALIKVAAAADAHFSRSSS